MLMTNYSAWKRTCQASTLYEKRRIMETQLNFLSFLAFENTDEES